MHSDDDRNALVLIDNSRNELLGERVKPAVALTEMPRRERSNVHERVSLNVFVFIIVSSAFRRLFIRHVNWITDESIISLSLSRHRRDAT